jgi:hypothetical protein
VIEHDNDLKTYYYGLQNYLKLKWSAKRMVQY